VLKPLPLIGQAVVYLVFAVFLGFFSDSPAYVHFPPEKALIKLSFTHGGERKGGCRRRTAEELAALPPNMRKPMDCPRERVPLLMELEVDGEVFLHRWLAPTGLARDGQSHIYERIQVTPGRHLVIARLRDSERPEGYDYVSERAINVRSGQSLAIDFRHEMGGFVFK